MFCHAAKRCILKIEWKNGIRKIVTDVFIPNIYPTTVSCLETRLRVATEETGSILSTIGMFCEAGPFNEAPERNGFTNFFEYMAYKSFNRVSAVEFENKIAQLGLSMKAYTARDHAAFYTTSCNNNVEYVLNILADVLFECALRHDDIFQAKRQLAQQLQDQDHDYKRMVFDLLHRTAYQGTRMGQTIEGPTKNMSSYDRNNISNFICEQFQPWRMALVSSGGLSHNDFLCQVQNSRFGQYFGNLCVKPFAEQRRFTGSEVRFRNDNLPFAHIAIAVQAPGFSSPDFLPMLVASSIIGKWDRSQGGGLNNASIVAQAVSTNDGAERLESFYLPYKNTGLWGFYFVADGMKIEDILYYIQSEWMRLCTSVTTSDIERGVYATKMNLAKIFAHQESSCKDLGIQVLYTSCRKTLAEYFQALADIRPHAIQSACYQYLYDRCPVVAAVGPTEALTDYNRIRSGMYWLRF